MRDIAALGRVVARSPVIRTAPLGPTRRRFANAALVLDTPLAPEDCLDALKRLERRYGRRRGQAWGDRVLDCDIVLWSGGAHASPRLTIPHPQFRARSFVLAPAAAIVPAWRDPLTGLTIRQLHHRLTRMGRLPR